LRGVSQKQPGTGLDGSPQPATGQDAPFLLQTNGFQRRTLTEFGFCTSIIATGNQNVNSGLGNWRPFFLVIRAILGMLQKKPLKKQN
jgi:hypothetical protein